MVEFLSNAICLKRLNPFLRSVLSALTRLNFRGLSAGSSNLVGITSPEATEALSSPTLSEKLKSSIQNESLMSFFLIAIIFSIPISPSLKSIFIASATGLIFLMPAYQKRFLSILSEPFTIGALMLSGIALLGCSWSVAAFPASFYGAEKYLKLVYIPLFAIGFTNRKNRMMGINIFLLSAFVVSLLSIGKHWHLLDYNGAGDPGQVFYNHIVTGYMIAFAAFLSALYATRTQKIARISYGLLAILFTYQVLFVNTGRTGYVVYLIFLAVLSALSFKSKRQLIALIIFSTLLGGLVVSASSVLSNRVHEVFDDLHHYKRDDKNTSVGYRLQFHQYAKSLFTSSPIIGYGTAGFKAQFKNDNPIPQRGDTLNDPHSQYWFVASEFGILGIAGLCYFLVTLFIQSFRLVEMKAVLLGLLVSFIFANMTDSFLTNTGIGYLFVMFCALSLGEFLENKKEK